jgi:hypothetical protein
VNQQLPFALPKASRLSEQKISNWNRLEEAKAAMAAPILRRITHLIMISRKRTLLRQRVNYRVVRVRCRLHAELTTLCRSARYRRRRAACRCRGYLYQGNECFGPVRACSLVSCTSGSKVASHPAHKEGSQLGAGSLRILIASLPRMATGCRRLSWYGTTGLPCTFDVWTSSSPPH